MKCESYQTFVVENYDLTVREKASALTADLREHVAQCPGCAEFAREHARLADAMRALKREPAAPQTWERLAGMEANLVAAFRHQQIEAAAEDEQFIRDRRNYEPEVSRIVQVSPSDRYSTGSEILRIPQILQSTNLWKWGTLAAVIMLALGVILKVSQTRTIPPPPRLTYLPHPPSDSLIPRLAVGPEGSRDILVGGIQPATVIAASAANPLKVDRVNNAANYANPAQSSSQHYATVTGQTSAPPATGISSSGDFIQLLPGTPGFFDDGPVVMRVQMPYSTVEYLQSTAGTPIALPSYNSSYGQSRALVQADLLVGSDGVARAIRFVN
jgi:hypothetical protein